MKLSLSYRAPRGAKTLLMLPLFGALALTAPRSAPAADPRPPTGAVSIGDWVPPAEGSAIPKAAEWETAAPLTLLRPHLSCTARALREWIQITCRHPEKFDAFMGVRTVGGSAEGVHMTDLEPIAGNPRAGAGVNVVFPVRKGDRRLIAIDESLQVGFKSYAIEENTVIMISDLWLPGDPGPTIVVD